MTEDPRMRLTLDDCRIDTPAGAARRAELARREDVDAPYLGRRSAPAESPAAAADAHLEEIAAGVAAGLKAKQRGRV